MHSRPERAALLALLVAAGALAGCLAPAADPLGPEAGGGDAPAAQPGRGLASWGCREQETAYLVPIRDAEASGLYPHGFAPAAVDPAGQLTAVAYAAFDCAGASWPGGGVGRHAWLASFALVEPPQALARPGAPDALHLLLLGLVADEPRLLDLVASWGVRGLHRGAVALEWARADPDAQLAALRADLRDGGGLAVVRSAARGTPQPTDALAMRVFSAEPAPLQRVVAVLDVDKDATDRLAGAATATLEGDLRPPFLPAIPIAPLPAPVATHYGALPFGLRFDVAAAGEGGDA